jgi:excisionase family DNA binding protein
MQEQRVILTAADLAPLLGISRRRVYQLIHSGGLPAIREGRAIKIPRPAFEAWLADQAARAVAAMRTVKVG